MHATKADGFVSKRRLQWILKSTRNKKFDDFFSQFIFVVKEKRYILLKTGSGICMNGL